MTCHEAGKPVGRGDAGTQTKYADRRDEGPNKLVLQIAVWVKAGRSSSRPHNPNSQQHLFGKALYSYMINGKGLATQILQL